MSRMDPAMDACMRLLSYGYRGLVSRALQGWVERRDPSYCYHVLSKLDPGYYGWSVAFSRYEEFYKRLPSRYKVRLPKPIAESGIDVLKAIASRRSRRNYSKKPLGLLEVATILYYAVGVTGRAWWGGPKRTYPSAGGLQPVEAYLVALNVEGLEQGVYHYNPGSHSLELIYTEALGANSTRPALDRSMWLRLRSA